MAPENPLSADDAAFVRGALAWVFAGALPPDPDAPEGTRQDPAEWTRIDDLRTRAWDWACGLAIVAIENGAVSFAGLDRRRARGTIGLLTTVAAWAGSPAAGDWSGRESVRLSLPVEPERMFAISETARACFAAIEGMDGRALYRVRAALLADVAHATALLEIKSKRAAVA
jgi:hypothetical protein